MSKRIHPLSWDPTRTTSMRAKQIRIVRADFASLRAKLRKLIAVDDAFGLAKPVHNEKRKFANCECEYPSIVLRNGSGHGLTQQGDLCPVHATYLQRKGMRAVGYDADGKKLTTNAATSVMLDDFGTMDWATRSRLLTGGPTENNYIDDAATVAVLPTQAQWEAGNYKKGHVTLHGFRIAIETAKGQRRRPQYPPIAAHYGYIKGTAEDSADGDHIDVFIGPDYASQRAFVVDQVDANGVFDEHKVMLGFSDPVSAKKAYVDSYGLGWRGFGDMREMPVSALKVWLQDGETKRPIAEQTSNVYCANVSFFAECERDEHGWCTPGGWSARAKQLDAMSKHELAHVVWEHNGGQRDEHHVADYMLLSHKQLRDLAQLHERNLYLKAEGVLNELVVNPFVSEAQRKACYAGAMPGVDCEEWEEKTHGKLPKHVSNAFCATGEGGGVDPTCAPGGHADSHAARVLHFAEHLPVAALNKVRGQVKTKYAKLSKRYGPTYAKAIIGAALVGLPVPLPGASLASASVVIALAELHRFAKQHLAKPDATSNSEQNLIDSEIAKLAHKLTAELKAEFAGLTVNKTFAFISDADKLEAFQQWLATQFNTTLTSRNAEELWKKYIQQGFAKGAGRAYDDATKKLPVGETPAFYQGARQQFLQTAFAQPVAREKVELLAARSFDEMQNLSEDAKNRMSRSLADALVEGKSPLEAANDIADELDVPQARAETIARTELIRAHAEGQLVALKSLGVKKLGVQVEFTVTDDSKLCDECAELAETVYDIEDAAGVIPVHPNCRCAWLPYAEDFDAEGEEEEEPTENKTGAWLVELRERQALANNRFCPTGPGGGVDPSCGKDAPASAPSPKILKLAKNPQFKAWFGDSKVVDPDGNPQETWPPTVVYHGTPRGPISAFDKSFIAKADQLHYGPGFYFTEDPKAAEVFAKGGHSESAKGANPTVMSFVLKAEKPFDVDVDKINPAELPEADRAIVRSSIMQKAFAEEGRSEAVEAGRAFDRGEHRMLYRDLTDAAGRGGLGVNKVTVAKLLQSKGHDSLTTLAPDAGEHGKNRYWIVFEPTQIKSVDNKGTFSANDPNVLNVEYVRDELGRFAATEAGHSDYIGTRQNNVLKRAVSDYTGGGDHYIKVNELLRSKPATLLNAHKPLEEYPRGSVLRTAVALQQGLQNAPDVGVAQVHRGLNEKMGAKLLKEAKPGATIRLDGFQSTSVNESVAHDFSEGVVLKINEPKGLMLGQRSYAGQSEVLLPHGADYKVGRISKADGKTVVELIQLNRGFKIGGTAGDLKVNVFCPTGPGGGVDPTCSPGGPHEVKGEVVTPPPPGPSYDPNTTADRNHDGVSDAARVGVPAFQVPPPPPIGRLPNLTPHERAVEKAFIEHYENDPDRTAAGFRMIVLKSCDPPTFGTDDAKVLADVWSHPDLETRAENRATLNLALHQTANAIAKRAFVQHLDTLKPGDGILVTVGGCGAGKGYAMGVDKNTGVPFVPQAHALKSQSKVVWDSAGDQNATENPWIQHEAEKRGLKVNYVYVHADPKTQWADPNRGVVKRAGDPNDGRMVDAKVFADSYALGAKNHQAFYERNKDNPNAKFVFLENRGTPKLLPGIPSEALKLSSNELADFALKAVKQSDAPERVKAGATAGERVWAGS